MRSMKRTTTEQNGDSKRTTYVVKQEGMPYGYETYISYAPATSTPTPVNQPLPGQPPLPPMPPPPGSVPPPPHVFVPSQVTPMQAWPHPPHWQWITPPATALPSQPVTNYQRDLPLRGSYVRRERFNNNNRNNIYNQRNNYHRNKNNRRTQRFESPQGQFDQNYFATTHQGNVTSDWQRNNFPTTTSEGIMGHIPVNIPNSMNHLNSPVANRRTDEDPDVRVISEGVTVKKNKQRKPMSQSYPSRPWNREDAERALKIESEYNKTVKAQSLIIKFPDPDLNKDIVREFHSGIQNIHFQSPSGPRYCFIQMSDNVNIDEAIKELEKVPFGVGHLKVERKSLRDDDNPLPEEIDPYTLYIGNLPESVNVNEVKEKFTTAARVDVGYAQKMRNTRYAFIRYNSVHESIAAYKQAHDLMWDTRSIIVRFRRQRGNTCLPGEQKNMKKVKKEAVQIEDNLVKEIQDKPDVNGHLQSEGEDSRVPRLMTSVSTISSLPSLSSTSPEKNSQNGTLESDVTTPPAISSPSYGQKEDLLLTEIKEEPQDYDELDMQMDDDDDDDDDDDEEDIEEEDEEEELEDDDDDDEETDEPEANNIRERIEDVPSDHLDRMFSDLDNIAGDISLSQS